MTKVIEYIIALFSQFSPAHQVVLVLIAGGFMFLGYNFVKNETFRRSILRVFATLFNNLRGKTNVSLRGHELLFKKQFHRNIINQMRFESEIKTKLFRTLLQIKSDTVIRMTAEWLKTLKLAELNKYTLYDTMSELLAQIVETYQRDIRKAYSELLPGKGDTAYALIYESEHGFATMHRDNVNYIMRNIQRIAFSEAFSPKQKVYAFMTQIEIATEIAITDCEVSFRTLNGNIEKLSK